MKKIYAESPILSVKAFDEADVITTSVTYGDDNVGFWGWVFGDGGDNNG